MPGRRLTILAIVSLVVLAVLLPGNVGRFGPTFGWPTGGVSPAYRAVDVVVEDGRFAVVLENDDKNAALLSTTLFRWKASLRPPRIDRLVWSFDCHRLNAGLTPGERMYIVACPLWCLELPCLIAPLLWWRRRKWRNPPGFAVIVPAGANLE